nr:RNA-directed DNA polymerase, eukaryota, reverse transcriptase zinc-binding domain protein [Tanacetum cinerariifolium]
FSGLKFSYLGGFWILIEFESSQSCTKFELHEGINSWFSILTKWVPRFKIKDRVVWIDIEGIPLRAWSQSNFERIARKWGELVHLDNSNVPNKYSMRVCVKTNVQHIIVESFKVVLEGKIATIRAKEVTGWIPDFDFGDDNSSPSDDDSKKNATPSKEPSIGSHEQVPSLSGDPFGMEHAANYSSLIQSHKEASNIVLDEGSKASKSCHNSLNGSYQDHADSRVRSSNPSNGFSILERFQEFINIGQAMGYDMKGSEKDFRKIISSIGENNGETKMENITDFAVKALWGTMSFDFASIPSRGRFGAEFNAFFVNSHLQDIPLGGYSFTWPILLKESLMDYGPTPFRLFHSWFLEDDFLSMVQDSWSIADNNSQNHMIKLKNKLKNLKHGLKAWGCDKKYLHNKERNLIQESLLGIDLCLDQGDRVPLVDQFPRVLSSDLSCNLEAMVSSHEIKKAIWDCGSDKTPGPNGSIPNGCNPSFIALILKVLDAKLFNDFRPISLVGYQYKIIGKILVNRLSNVMDDLISQEQSAFVKGRQIMEGPIILNEVISWCKAKKEKALLFKVNFQKAFDSVRWDHLDDILDKFGFGHTGMFTPIMVGHNNQVSISHLFYADDVMFIGKWSLEKVNALMLMLHYFFLTLGLKINVQKSSIAGIGVLSSIVHNMVAIFGCSTSKLPFSYLGGRLTLIKSVLGAIPTYFMSLFKVPKGVLKRLWINVIKAIHRNEGSLNAPPPNYGGSVWLGIILVVEKLKSKGIDLSSFCKLALGNGHSIKFWLDKWYGDTPFKDKFNRCFNLELQKDVSVAPKLQSTDLSFSFRRCPRSGIEESQLGELNSLVSSLILSNSSDRWSWSFCGSGIFTVKSARDFIDQYILVTSSPIRWSKVIPIKLNIFVWRFVLDKIPTRCNLTKRGVNIPCSLCPICQMELESRDHLVFRCSMALDLYSLFSGWWNIQFPSFHNFAVWEVWLASIRLNKNQKLVLEASFSSLWWHIWIFRNAFLFSERKPLKGLIFDNFVSQTFNWPAGIWGQGHVGSVSEVWNGLRTAEVQGKHLGKINSEK